MDTTNTTYNAPLIADAPLSHPELIIPITSPTEGPSDADFGDLALLMEAISHPPKTDADNLADILAECGELLKLKSSDYNQSRIKMGDYFPRGLHSIVDIMNMKILRIYSVLEKKGDTNFESVEDSAKDLINYASMFIACARGILKTPADRP